MFELQLSIMQNIRSESRNHPLSRGVRAARRRVAVVLILLVFAGGFGVPKLLAAVPEKPEIHVVTEGETLWELARVYSPSEDPRAYVHQVRRLNHLASAQVFPGQSLLLPD
jgi:hypothetical protein